VLFRYDSHSFSMFVIPSNKLIPGEHGSHWQSAAHCTGQVASTVLLRWDLVGDDRSRIRVDTSRREFGAY